MNSARIICGDAREVLATLPAESVRCVVTSPPYWGLRDYGHRQQLGLERTPEQYVAKMVAVFKDVRRILADDGTLWLNLGDCYAQGGRGAQHGRGLQGSGCNQHESRRALKARGDAARRPPPGLKPKDLVGIPWRVAFALQADGWFLRSDIIWAKPNPMPESITDRPTKAHEYVFLLSKSERYFYDADAIREPCVYGDHPRTVDATYQAPGQPQHKGLRKGGLSRSGNKQRSFRGEHGGVAHDIARSHRGFGVPWQDDGTGRNRRSVWSIVTQPFPEAHFAVMPEALVEPCILAGSGGGDMVLDPFAGAGTVGVVALKHGRNFIGIELNPTYAQMARDRIHNDAPLLNRAEVGT